MVGGQDRDSCRKSGRDETPQERMRRGGSSPRKAKSCTEINSGVTSHPY
ncbi:hypothetical protein MUB16_25020 [Priestia sp. OVL9]|nr:hypothetical protein [Priestia sp. OVL9]